MKVFKNIYLCLKYPFLYPRNRFTGKYRKWALSKPIEYARKKCFITFHISIQHLMDNEEFPKPFNSQLDAKAILHQYGIKYSLIQGNRFIVWDEDNYRYESKTLRIDPKEYKYCGNNIRAYKSGNIHINVTLYVRSVDKKKIRHGWGTTEINFIINPLWYIWHQFLSWTDTHICDPIFGLFPEYTELDSMPEGWRKAFGLQMCEDIKQALKKVNALHKYRIMQIKEKWGELCWYDAQHNREIQDVINKYSNKSATTCISCGKSAKYRTVGWICPYCEECVPKNVDYDTI